MSLTLKRHILQIQHEEETQVKLSCHSHDQLLATWSIYFTQNQMENQDQSNF